MRALVLVFLLLGVLTGCADGPGPRPGPPTPTASTSPDAGSGDSPSPAVADFSLFAADWGGHGSYLFIHSDGTFEMGARTYTVCGEDPPPCDDQSGHEIIDGSRANGALHSVSGDTATGEVLTTTDPETFPTGPVTFTIDPAKDSITAFGVTLCGDNSPDICGA